ncbi:hypothetical protein HHO41_03605 [Bacillus sp. DNRA2]|uniref:hypothetical protein n=1 Tax=Bacillus sp. DNRA2 TaxID=2723053 RepID=UPI00145DAC87|nr:hypothetical protein [Bacillus sp. DNRA2]NMD69361.1 hypothetical protein [Bacillus sp. DNRA2]
MKKNILLILMLIVVFLTSCTQTVDYTILDKEKVNSMSAVSTYIDELQSSNSGYKGYKIFDISDSNKVVVISSGESNKTLKIHNIENSSKDTAITIVQTDLPSKQKNSYVVIRLDEIIGAFYVFERVQYEGTDN